MAVIKIKRKKVYRKGSRVVYGSGVVVRHKELDKDLSALVNPADAMVGMVNLDKKIVPNNITNYKTPSVVQMNNQVLNGISFKKTKKQKKVKLTV
jgi:hypothetical protein